MHAERPLWSRRRRRLQEGAGPGDGAAAKRPGGGAGCLAAGVRHVQGSQASAAAGSTDGPDCRAPTGSVGVPCRRNAFCGRGEEDGADAAGAGRRSKPCAPPHLAARWAIRGGGWGRGKAGPGRRKCSKGACRPGALECAAVWHLVYPSETASEFCLAALCAWRVYHPLVASPAKNVQNTCRARGFTSKIGREQKCSSHGVSLIGKRGCCGLPLLCSCYVAGSLMGRVPAVEAAGQMLARLGVRSGLTACGRQGRYRLHGSPFGRF